MKKIVMALIFALSFTLLFAAIPEVDKGKIPNQYINSAVKKLPNGITIWDAQEAITAIDSGNTSYLWIDCSPKQIFATSTLKPAINLVYHKNEEVWKQNAGPRLTRATLNARKSGKTKIIYFCQGPRCHRSFNAALRSVQNWGIPVSQVVWLRAGAPGVLKHVLTQPQLKSRMNKYIKGTVLRQY